MDFIALCHSQLKVEDISNRISGEAYSAVLLYVGINVGDYDVRRCVSVEYEADVEHTVQIFKNICLQVRERWNVNNIAIYHRLGCVPIQEASIVISVSSPDISVSMQAFQYLITSVKNMSPVIQKDILKVKEEIGISVEEETMQNLSSSHLKDVNNQRFDKVPPHLIQVKADSREINRRINCFIERKREQVNFENIQDFCQYTKSTADDSSCARVDALLVRRKDSKSHLRVRRVLNTWGPQTRPVDNLNQDNSLFCHDGSDGNHLGLNQGQNFKSSDTKMLTGLTGVEERLKNAEEHLHISNPLPQDVYTRLKQIENRILYLESLSPEYFLFLEDVSQKSSVNYGTVKKKRYSQIDLSKKLEKLEFELANKTK